eukprot:2522458-Amphidinium_carterae.2
MGFLEVETQKLLFGGHCFAKYRISLLTLSSRLALHLGCRGITSSMWTLGAAVTSQHYKEL